MKKILRIPNPAIVVLCAIILSQPAHSESTLTLCATGMTQEQCEFSRLYGAVRRLNEANVHDFIDQSKFIEGVPYHIFYVTDDLMLVLYKHKPLIYIFTPYYGGNAELSANTEGNKICNQNAWNPYNVNIPYFPNNDANGNGYYQLIFYAGIYGPSAECNLAPDFVVFQPLKSSGQAPHLVLLGGHANGYFSAPSAKEAETQKDAWTAWQKNTKIPENMKNIQLVGQENLWNKESKNNFLPDARQLLIDDMAFQIKTMPPEEKVGDYFVTCPGAGCGKYLTKQDVDTFNELRADAIDYARAVATEYNLDIFTNNVQTLK